MIDDQVKIHNKFSVELKLGFTTRRKQKRNDFVVNTWIFIPNSLDINPYTYEKKDFYKDLKSNIRLITPVYLLRDIIQDSNSPINLLETALNTVASDPSRTNINKYEYHIKMFVSIVKSAIRNETNHILSNKIDEDKDFLIDTFVSNIRKLTSSYRDLRRIINVPTIETNLLNFYHFGDIFMSNLIEQHAFRLLDNLSHTDKRKQSPARNLLIQLIKKERGYKTSKDIPITENQKARKNRELVYQFNLLKKYAENVLFLTARRKKDGILKEQIFLSLAAGISMVFATAIAFSFQKTYGNFTMPFFVALVVSYMLKDRIKELGRYYFAHKLGKSYFDHKTHIALNNNNIGWSKEAVDFIPEKNTPEEVIRIRNRSAILEADNRNNNEKILLYRKRVRLNRRNLDKCGDYQVTGIHDILRFNVFNFTQKMDNPEVPLYSLGHNNEVIRLKGEKIYYLNLIIQFRFEEQLEYRRYRLVLNRSGIKQVESLHKPKSQAF
ncbi:MAG: hypothetical protein AB7D35_11230 [Bacteroidales bacterium]